MNNACWKAATDGRYSIDIAIGAARIPMMIDTGLVDPVGRVAFEIEPTLFDSLEQSGSVGDHRFALAAGCQRTYNVAQGGTRHGAIA